MEGVVSFTAHPHIPLGKELLLPIGLDAGWAPQLVWMWQLREKSFVTIGNEAPVINLVD
jgi:hypothetical protein